MTKVEEKKFKINPKIVGLIVSSTVLLGVFAFGFAEWKLRRVEHDVLIYRDSADPLLRFEPIPSVEGVLNSADVRLNSAGFRDDDYPAEKPAGCRRLIVVGDAQAFGRGVSRSAVFTERMKTRLVPGCEVINASVNAYNADQELRWMETRVVPFRPDVVLWMVSSDDFETLPPFMLSHMARLKNSLREKSLVARYFMQASFRKKARSPRYQQHVRTGFWVAEAYAAEESGSESRIPPAIQGKANAVIQQGGALAKLHGFRLIVLYVPRLDRYHEIEPAPEDVVRRDALEMACRAQSIPFWDASASLATPHPLYHLVEVDSPYLNETGHQLLADFVCQSMKKERGLELCRK
ncbi:MAG TPA: hypothetical protein PK876_03605 [Elusimicrobiota bacterium]|nr:hypothetical protein [Elusimicrobiota bacterium]